MEVVIIATLLKGLKLKDISPPNIIADPKANAIAQALDPELNAITETIPEAVILPRIDDIKPQVLDLLAWQFHADFYDLTVPLSYATERLKREAVKNSLHWHSKKGTVWAIREALRQLDIEAQFVPWWEFGGEPYTFMLDAIVAGDFYKTSGKDILVKSIVRAVNEAKSARSFMAGLNVSIHDDASMTLYAAGASLLEGSMTVRPVYTDRQEYHLLNAGAAFLVTGEMKILAAYDDMQEAGTFFAGTGMFTDGEITVGIQHDDEEIQCTVSQAIGMYLEYQIEIGVGDTDMQELLEKFEQSISSKLEELKEEVKSLIAGNKAQWAEDDEE